MREKQLTFIPHADWCHEDDRHPDFPCACDDYRREIGNAMLPSLVELLTQQRQQVLAPFLALAGEFDAESKRALARADRDVYRRPAELRHARVARHHASAIRGVIENTAL